MSINLSNNMSKKLVTVSEKMMVEEALMVMKNHHFRHLPVVNDKNDIVGIVSDRDLYKALNTEEVELGGIMSKPIYKVDVKTNMKEIVDNMIKMKISAFLVTRDGEATGIITSEDMMQLLSQLLEGEKAGLSLLDEFLQAADEATGVVKNPNLIT